MRTEAVAMAVPFPPARTGTASLLQGLVIAALLLVLAGCMPARWERPPEPGAALPPAETDVTGASAQAPATAPGSTARSAPEPAPRSAPRSALGNPPFYEVFGKRYHVLPDGEGFTEHGVASWYGKKFHGRLTSSGEVYDMHQLTAAHRTLPLPTVVRVTNLANGRSVVVTVNDRGPFAHERVIDLSYAAAMELDMVEAGLAEVSIEAMAEGSPQGPLPDVYMQVGAFGEVANAEALKTRVEGLGIPDVLVHRDDSGRRTLYRVRIGPLSGVAEFDELAARLAPLNIDGPRVVSETPQPARLP